MAPFHSTGGRGKGSELGSTPALKPASVSLLRQPASLNLTFGMCTVETVTLPRCRNCGMDSRQVRPRGLAMRMRRLLLSACRALYAVCKCFQRSLLLSAPMSGKPLCLNLSNAGFCETHTASVLLPPRISTLLVSCLSLRWEAKG